MPTISSSSPPSSGEAQHLIGKLEPNGLATLHIDKDTLMSSNQTKHTSLKAALVQPSLYATGTDSDSTSTTSEDYDKLEIELETVVDGAKGGGLDSPISAADNHSSSDVEPARVFEEIKTGKSSLRRPGAPMRIQSIPVTLKESDKDGKYLLVADNAEVRKVLKMTTERVSSTNHYSKLIANAEPERTYGQDKTTK